MGDRREKARYISNKIKEKREDAKWSQAELARRAGVTSAAISQLEKGDRIPSLVVSRKLAKTLKISINELTGDETPTTDEISSDAQAFFRDFGDIEELHETDKEIIRDLVSRLKDRANDERGK